MEVSFKGLLQALYDPSLPTNAVAVLLQRHTALLGSSVANDFKTLQELVKRHEATIRETWKKKRRGRREKIILKSWPDLPRKHRADLDIHLFGSSQAESAGEYFTSDEFMWPYLNLEDLCKTQPILILLNSRARNVPRTFAETELFHSPFSFTPPCADKTWEDCNMYCSFTDDPDPKKYGHIFVKQESEYTNNMPDDAFQICPRRGLHILRIQQQVYSFLVTFCKELLSSVLEDDLLGYSIQPEPPLADLQMNDREYNTMTELNFIYPCRGHTSFEFVRLHGYAAALLQNAQDHVWALREDPSYFMDSLQQKTEHGIEWIQDSDGDQCLALGTLKHRKLRAAHMITEAYDGVCQFHVLKTCLDHFEKAFRDGRDSRQRFVAMSSLYVVSLGCLSSIKTRLKNQIRAAPGTRQYFTREGTTVLLKHKAVQGMSYNEREFWRIYKLFENMDPHEERDRYPIAALYLERLDFLICNDKQISSMISPRISEGIAVVSILLEIIRQTIWWFGTNKVQVNSNHYNFGGRLDELYEEFPDWNSAILDYIPPMDSLDPIGDYPVYNLKSPSNVKTAIQG